MAGHSDTTNNADFTMKNAAAIQQYLTHMGIDEADVNKLSIVDGQLVIQFSKGGVVNTQSISLDALAFFDDSLASTHQNPNIADLEVTELQAALKNITSVSTSSPHVIESMHLYESADDMGNADDLNQIEPKGGLTTNSGYGFQSTIDQNTALTMPDAQGALTNTDNTITTTAGFPQYGSGPYFDPGLYELGIEVLIDPDNNGNTTVPPVAEDDDSVVTEDDSAIEGDVDAADPIENNDGADNNNDDVDDPVEEGNDGNDGNDDIVLPPVIIDEEQEQIPPPLVPEVIPENDDDDGLVIVDVDNDSPVVPSDGNDETDPNDDTAQDDSSDDTNNDDAQPPAEDDETNADDAIEEEEEEEDETAADDDTTDESDDDTNGNTTPPVSEDDELDEDEAQDSEDDTQSDTGNTDDGSGNQDDTGSDTDAADDETDESGSDDESDDDQTGTSDDETSSEDDDNSTDNGNTGGSSDPNNDDTNNDDDPVVGNDDTNDTGTDIDNNVDDDIDLGDTNVYDYLEELSNGTVDETEGEIHEFSDSIQIEDVDGVGINGYYAAEEETFEAFGMTNETLTSGGMEVIVDRIDNVFHGIRSDNKEVFTLEIDRSSGAYTFVAHDILDHGNTEDSNDAIYLKFGVVISRGSILEGTYDTLVSNIVVKWNDDGPVLEPDFMDTEPGVTVTGDVLENDEIGEDDVNTGPMVIDSVNGEPLIGAALVVTGVAGILTMNKNGIYSYQAYDVPNGSLDEFTYEVKDGDGDTESTTLTFNVERAYDEDGNLLYTDENGTPYYIDENGNNVYRDGNNEPYFLNGDNIAIYQNDDGDYFYTDDNGEIVFTNGLGVPIEGLQTDDTDNNSDVAQDDTNGNTPTNNPDGDDTNQASVDDSPSTDTTDSSNGTPSPNTNTGSDGSTPVPSSTGLVAQNDSVSLDIQDSESQSYNGNLFQNDTLDGESLSSLPQYGDMVIINVKQIHDDGTTTNHAIPETLPFVNVSTDNGEYRFFNNGFYGFTSNGQNTGLDVFEYVIMDKNSGEIETAQLNFDVYDQFNTQTVSNLQYTMTESADQVAAFSNEWDGVSPSQATTMSSIADGGQSVFSQDDSSLDISSILSGNDTVLSDLPTNTTTESNQGISVSGEDASDTLISGFTLDNTNPLTDPLNNGSSDTTW